MAKAVKEESGNSPSAKKGIKGKYTWSRSGRQTFAAEAGASSDSRYLPRKIKLGP